MIKFFFLVTLTRRKKLFNFFPQEKFKIEEIKFSSISFLLALPKGERK